MKKTLEVIISLVLAISLVACGKETSESGTSVVSEPVASVSEENVEAEKEQSVVTESVDDEKVTSTETSAQTVTSVEEVVEEVDKTWEYHVDVSWIDPEKPMVALSFDDGPVSSTSDTSTAMRIQNALSENGMHATFFYWGATLNAITQKEIERAYELGFELGNHTKTHPDLTKLSKEEIEKEVAYIDGKLSQIAVGQERFLVRPPYLSVNDDVKDAIIAPLISCGMDTKDWNGASAQDIIDTIVNACEKGTLDGQIVLLHETYPTTAEAIEYLVPYLKEQGYQVVSISEMYCARGKTMKGGKVYSKCAK